MQMYLGTSVVLYHIIQFMKNQTNLNNLNNNPMNSRVSIFREISHDNNLNAIYTTAKNILLTVPNVLILSLYFYAFYRSL